MRRAIVQRKGFILFYTPGPWEARKRLSSPPRRVYVQFDTTTVATKHVMVKQLLFNAKNFKLQMEIIRSHRFYILFPFNKGDC
jgi:hypothetical protein